MRIALASALCLCTLSPIVAVAEQSRQEGPVKVTPIIKADRNIAGQPIVFPQKDGEVTVTTYEFPPGADLPVHKHPYPRIGYVLAGTLEIVNEDTGKTDTLKTGDVLLEAVDQWHHGKNVGDVPVKMLVIDTDQKGVPQTVPRK